MGEKHREEKVVRAVERIGDDTVKLLGEVRESLRDNLEHAEGRWLDVESRLGQLKQQLKKPTHDASKAAIRFGTEMKRTSNAVLRTLRDFKRG